MVHSATTDEAVTAVKRLEERGYGAPELDQIADELRWVDSASELEAALAVAVDAGRLSLLERPDRDPAYVARS